MARELREVLNEGYEKLRRMLFSRQLAYRDLFNMDKPSAKAVLEDLAHFCRAHESTFHTDERAQSLLEGRREVWLRIQNHLELDSHKLWKLYGRKDLE